jgi:pterin-4a-carbinolamine dehydratase
MGGDELVTYNLAKLAHDVEHHPDGYMEDSD